jgi:photosystem II PsbY protein
LEKYLRNFIYLREEPMDGIDFRIAIVLAPLLLAAGWAVFNIGAAALKQVQSFWAKAK